MGFKQAYVAVDVELMAPFNHKYLFSMAAKNHVDDLRWVDGAFQSQIFIFYVSFFYDS